MPVLPLIDLLILLGTGSLMVGFVLKSIAISTSYRPSLLGLTSIDFLIATGICLLFALTLAARTWVRANEGRLHVSMRRRVRDLREVEFVSDPNESEADEPAAVDSVAEGR